LETLREDFSRLPELLALPDPQQPELDALEEPPQAEVGSPTAADETGQPGGEQAGAVDQLGLF
ncbi:MAG: hypothetical protein WAN93_03930, partial [Solirubrobacteraceae bacterium]